MRNSLGTQTRGGRKGEKGMDNKDPNQVGSILYLGSNHSDKKSFQKNFLMACWVPWKGHRTKDKPGHIDFPKFSFPHLRNRLINTNIMKLSSGFNICGSEVNFGHPLLWSLPPFL